MTIFSTTVYWWSPVNRIFHYWVLVIPPRWCCLTWTLTRRAAWPPLLSPPSCPAPAAATWTWQTSCRQTSRGRTSISAWTWCRRPRPGWRRCAACHYDSFLTNYGNITTGASGCRNVYIVGHWCQSWHHSLGQRWDFLVWDCSLVFFFIMSKEDCCLFT